MLKFLIATHNQGKFIEIKEVLAGLQNIKFVSLKDLGIKEDIHEHGKTFAENAKIKAEFFAAKSGLPTIADDSGIHIDALENELGVFTRRWGAGPKASDEEWMRHFLARLAKENNRQAEFVCNAAVSFNGKTRIFEGKTYGVITKQMEAAYLPGLPLSAVFRPRGFQKVFSALSVEEKNRISHRGKAFAKVREYLSTILKGETISKDFSRFPIKSKVKRQKSKRQLKSQK